MNNSSKRAFRQSINSRRAENSEFVISLTIGQPVTATVNLPEQNAMTQTFALLDRAHLDAMTGGDTALAKEVVEIFREQAEIWSRMLDPQAETTQWADAAHTLKGASLGIGAIRLAAKCETAEKAGRSDTPPSVTAAAVMLGEIKDVLGDTLEEVAQLLYDYTSPPRRVS
ncbi:MAG TPA: hypothetical protein DD728_00640 [Hyphomonas atlantica]|uniref:HPt domain-containing protein n=2 Tax=Hyphomonas atlantica TaxID=1280948 RepID=A0A356W1F4_9PROT|nr:hypothetical protein [Hyphomonas atlantica]